MAKAFYTLSSAELEVLIVRIDQLIETFRGRMFAMSGTASATPREEVLDYTDATDQFGRSQRFVEFLESRQLDVANELTRRETRSQM